MTYSILLVIYTELFKERNNRINVESEYKLVAVPPTTTQGGKSPDNRMSIVRKDNHRSAEDKLVETSLQIIEQSQNLLFNDNKFKALAIEETNKTMRKYLKKKEKLNI